MALVQAEQTNTATNIYPSDATTATNVYSNDYCWHRLPCGMCALTHGTYLKPVKQYSFDKFYCGGNPPNVTLTNDCT